MTTSDINLLTLDKMSIVDGHIVLDRKLASRGQYPAIDILSSVSRLMSDVVNDDQLRLCYKFRNVLSDYAKIEDLVNLGAYEKGNNKKADYAVETIDNMTRFLKQGVDAKATMEEGIKKLEGLFKPSDIQQI